MITNFNDLFAELKAKGICKRMIAAWGVDSHTIEAASLASDMGFVKVTLVGDADMIAAVCKDAKINVEKFTIVDIKDELKAVAEAVRMVHDGEGDVLMKGLCSTDKFLRAILNKEVGLLPPKGLLSHVGVIENPNYHKLIFITDMAVIPAPDFRQKVKMAGFVTAVAHSFGIAMPKIAFIAASEQMLDSMPACIEGAMLAKMCDRGQIHRQGVRGNQETQEPRGRRRRLPAVPQYRECQRILENQFQTGQGRASGRFPGRNQGALHPGFPGRFRRCEIKFDCFCSHVS